MYQKPDILDLMANIANDEVFTSAKVVNDVLDLLPKEVWSNKDLRWLDPVCKNGVWLREIYRRLDEGLKEEISSYEVRKIHILDNMLFGYATSNVAWMMTCRTLYVENKTKMITNSEGVSKISRVHAWKDSPFCKNIINKQFLEEDFDNMPQFDIIVGNPPYQSDDGKGEFNYSTIYHKYILHCISMSPKYLSMITPSRWLKKQCPGKVADGLLDDKRFAIIKHFSDAKDVFSGESIGGGVSYFLWDRDYNDKCLVNGKSRSLNELDIFLFNEIECTIVKKIKSITKKDDYVQFMRKSMSPIKPGDKSDSGFKVYGTNLNIEYCSNITDKFSVIDKWKVCTSKSSDCPVGDKVYNQLGRLFIAEPGSLASGTYLTLCWFDTKIEALNFISYCKTRLFRFLVHLTISTFSRTAKNFMWVPDLKDYTKPWTDEELYKMFNLNQDEIQHIENTIKERV